MTSSEVQVILNLIANEPGRLAKQNLMEEFMKEEMFQYALRMAYEPTITFNILNVSVDEYGDGVFNGATRELLSMLHRRELSGMLAKEEVLSEMMRLDDLSATLLYNILNKDLRAGINVKSINAAAKAVLGKKLVTGKPPYMRCLLPKDTKLKDWPWENGVYSQQKMDAMFCNLNVISKEHVELVTRTGYKFPELVVLGFLDEAKKLTEGYQYHGEFIVERGGELLPRKTSNGIMNSLLKGGMLPRECKLVYYAWDMIPLSRLPEGRYDTPYHKRFHLLTETLLKDNDIRLVDTKIVYSLAEAYQHFGEERMAGREGTIIKHPDAIWKDGNSNEQIKIKVTREADLRVKAMMPGTGKNAATFGSLLCVTDDGLVEVQVGGFTDAERQEIFEGWKEWKDEIISILYMELTESTDAPGKFSLYLPRYVERRYDKHTTDSMESLA